MPVHKVQGGYSWGSGHGKFATKAQAEAQGRAAYANGYKGDERNGWVEKDCAGEAHSDHGVGGDIALMGMHRGSTSASDHPEDDTKDNVKVRKKPGKAIS